MGSLAEREQERSTLAWTVLHLEQRTRQPNASEARPCASVSALGGDVPRCSPAWLHSLGSDASDHCPLLLHTNLGSMSKARFHFEVFWPRFEDYAQVVAEAWSGQVTAHEPIDRLDAKLTALVKALQSWSAAVLGSAGSKSSCSWLVNSSTAWMWHKRLECYQRLREL
jgi:hypothetical protein